MDIYIFAAIHLRDVMEGVGLPIYSLSNAGKTTTKTLTDLSLILQTCDVTKERFDLFLLITDEFKESFLFKNFFWILRYAPLGPLIHNQRTGKKLYVIKEFFLTSIYITKIDSFNPKTTPSPNHIRKPWFA